MSFFRAGNGGIELREKIVPGIMIFSLMAGLTTQAASDIKVLTINKLEDVKYNGKIYQYVIEEEYETDDPDQEITFNADKGWTLKETVYSDPEPVEDQDKDKKEQTRTYKNLIEKDESKIPDTLQVGKEEYQLKDIIWKEEPNMEKVHYTQDFGYQTEKPDVPASYEYTYTSPVTKKDNTVNLPLVRVEQTDSDWVDGFSATVTFHNIDGGTFDIGGNEYDYDEDNISLDDTQYQQLIRMLGYDTSKYRLTSIAWKGGTYESGDVTCRDAVASGQQYASKYSAYYEDKVENGKIYTANAVYELETDQKPVYRMKATGYFEKDSVWKNIISFVTENPVKTVGIFLFIIIIILAACMLVRLMRKREKKDGDYNE